MCEVTSCMTNSFAYVSVTFRDATQELCSYTIDVGEEMQSFKKKS